MPSLRQLQYLVALSDTGHYRLAAERSGVSQPTLSAQLLALERRLGVQLAERSRSPVLMTSAGAQVAEISRRILTLVQEVNDCALVHRQGMAGVLRLGLPSSISSLLLPAVVPALHSDYPELRLHIREDYPSALPDSLTNGKYDFLIAPLPVRGEDFETLRVFREPLYLAVPADHTLSGETALDPSALKGQAVLVLEKGHALQEQVAQICADFGANVLHDFGGTSLNTLHQMAATGLGWTFLPGLYARSSAGEGTGVRLLSLQGKPLYRTIGLVWRGGSPQAEHFRRIAAYVKAAVKRNYPDFLVHDS
jgi:LysR family hydrogen peroxide-inducible transcriptional activator